MPTSTNPSPASELTLVVIVEGGMRFDPTSWQRVVEEFSALRARILVLDRTASLDHSSIPYPVVRDSSPMMGLAIMRLAEGIDTDAVMFVEPESELHTEAITAAVRVLRLERSVGLVLCDFELSEGNNATRSVRLDALPPHPPPGWIGGAVFRKKDLENLSSLAFYPVFLERYRSLLKNNRVAHLPLVAHRLSAGEFRTRLDTLRSQSRWLDQLESNPEPMAPEISVLLVVHGPVQTVWSTLRSLCEQTLPPQQIQVVMVAEGPHGNLDELDPDDYPIRIDKIRRRAHGLTKALNKALTQAVAPITAFIEPGLTCGPDWARKHLEKHGESEMLNTVVVGPVLQPERSRHALSWILDERSRNHSSLLLRGLRFANLSLPTRRLQAIGGVAPANRTRTIEVELAYRLSSQGLGFTTVETPVHLLEPTSLEHFLENSTRWGHAQVELCDRAPEAIDLLGLARLDLDSLIERERSYERRSTELVEAAAELSDIRPEIVGGRQSGGHDASQGILEGLRSRLEELGDIAEFEGIVRGLRALGVVDFPNILRKSPLHLHGSLAAPWVLVPCAQDPRWLGILRQCLLHPDRRPIVLWAHTDTDYEPEQLLVLLESIRQRLALQSRHEPAQIFVLQADPPAGRLIRFLAAAHACISTGNEHEASLLLLAKLAECPVRAFPDTSFEHLPWPIGTSKAIRVLAWPNWDDPEELEALFSRYAALLIGSPDACLCLRLCPETDPTESLAVSRLETAFDDALGSCGDLEIILLSEPLGAADWARVELAVDAIIRQESRDSAPKTRTLRNMQAIRTIDTPMALKKLLERHDSLASKPPGARFLILEPPHRTLSEHP